MKITRRVTKVRLAVGTISMSSMAIAVAIGLASPAVAPSRADALQAVTVQYSNASTLSDTQLVSILQAVGFQGQALKYAWAIAKKESNGQPLHYNGNLRTGDNSFGLFQINMLGSMGPSRRATYGLEYNAQLLNPVVNANVAYQMSDHGKDWSAWKGTRNSVVKMWLEKYPYQTKAVAKAKAKVKAKAKAVAKAKTKAKH